jgi:predicted secreted protein
MGWFTGVVVFIIIWWVVVFMVLPWGARPPENPEPGHAPSAPENPQMLKKALVTTALAAVIWLGIYAVVESDLVSFREIVGGDPFHVEEAQ